MDIENFKTTARVDGNIVIIAMERMPNNFKTKEEGIPVFEDFPFIRIITPSAKNQEVHRKVTNHDKTVPNPTQAGQVNYGYKEQWDAFEAKEQHKASGTPLCQWPEMESGLISVYEFNHVYTVEDLVGVNEANIVNLGMGASGLQAKAKKYLEGKHESDIVLENALTRIEELEKLVNKLTGAVEANPAVSEMEEQDELTEHRTGHP